jgi:8-oxo-dGTP diphosphatase
MRDVLNHGCPEASPQMPDPARHSVSVAAVIVDDDGRALLVRRRDNGHWEPPGGVLELDEDIAAGLRREVAEETGLSVEPTALTGVYKNMKRGVVALVFRCRATGGVLATSGETADLRWTRRDEVAELADPAYAVRVLDALDLAASPAIRAHDGVHLS